jgi:isopropylmalate/homocitrate/citramalate synthase
MRFFTDEAEVKRVVGTLVEREVSLLRVFAAVELMQITPGRQLRITDDLKVAANALLKLQSDGLSLTSAPRKPTKTTPEQALAKLSNVKEADDDGEDR